MRAGARTVAVLRIHQAVEVVVQAVRAADLFAGDLEVEHLRPSTLELVHGEVVGHPGGRPERDGGEAEHVAGRSRTERPQNEDVERGRLAGVGRVHDRQDADRRDRHLHPALEGAVLHHGLEAALVEGAATRVPVQPGLRTHLDVQKRLAALDLVEVQVARSAGVPLVDLLVAVVVEVVADLRHRIARRAGLRDAAQAGRDGAGALAHAAGQVLEALVRTGDAVVVEAVADLGRVRVDHRTAIIAVAVLRGAVELGGSAVALVRRLGLAVAVPVHVEVEPVAPDRVLLVGLLVAVVVEAVADLVDREHFVYAEAPLAPDAGRDAAVADTDALGPFRTGVAEARQALVGLLVAVVVEAVADLVDRLVVLNAHEHARHAGRGAGGALAEELGLAAHATARVFLVRHAAAVVVEAVADLGRVGMNRRHGVVAVHRVVDVPLGRRAGLRLDHRIAVAVGVGVPVEAGLDVLAHAQLDVGVARIRRARVVVLAVAVVAAALAAADDATAIEGRAALVVPPDVARTVVTREALAVVLLRPLHARGDVLPLAGHRLVLVVHQRGDEGTEIAVAEVPRLVRGLHRLDVTAAHEGHDDAHRHQEPTEPGHPSPPWCSPVIFGVPTTTAGIHHSRLSRTREIAEP